ncbi:phage tail assembly protein [Stenotrophomonas sp. GD03680]|uniref:phage tail assembly protein n=1 Tax=Stenotrophomonas sp. GD03680 TaxID=2975365 RepID=UPI00244BCE43|nr:phage tail assembly protein [Stenotrophomonas sp. GD03680]MDH2022269.1 phage tail assembly protein [Stenotrophomonas sp. GD03680]
MTGTTIPNVQKAARKATITLEEPLQRGDSQITSVEVRRPGAGELRGLKLVEVLNMDVTALATLLPRITNPTLTSGDVAALDAADLLQFGMETAAFFMTREQATAQGYPTA